MNRPKISSFLLFPILVAIGGCCENGTAPTGAAPNGNGSIAGRVILFDSVETLLTNFSGVQVSIDGTSMAMVTDSTGNWQFSGMASGIYNVTATKPGFGTFHWYEQSVNNERINEETADLAQMSTYTPSVTSASWDSIPMLGLRWVTIYYSHVPAEITIVGYCDLDSNIRPSDAHLIVAESGNSANNYLTFSYDDLIAAGARPGETIYLSTAHVFAFFNGSSIGSQYTFIDPSHNNEVRYASNGPKSNVIAVQMPQ